MGFVGALTPTSSNCEDAWLICTALAGDTERLKFLVAFRPGFLLPTLAAQMAATMQRITDNRVLINIVTGGDADEQQSFGDFLDHDARYDRTGEFLDVFRRCWDGQPFDYEGAHFQVRGGGLRSPFGRAARRRDRRHLLRWRVACGGARRSAAHADVYLLWGEPPEWVAERVTRMRALAAEQGRALRFGIRLHVIARDARGGRARRRRGHPRNRCSRSRSRPRPSASPTRSRSDSSGWPRSTTASVDMDALFVSPNLWAGIGLVRRRRRYGARRQLRPGRRPHPRVRTRSASTRSSCPATRTSKSATTSARRCSRASATPSQLLPALNAPGAPVG